MPQRPIVTLTALAALLTACAPAPEPGPTGLEVRAAATSRVDLLLGGEPLAAVRVEHVDLDRVEAALHPTSGQIAVVVHHGRAGGAELRLHQGPRLLRADTPDDLSAPRWSPDGRTLALVLRRPAILEDRRLRHRGELLLLDPRAPGRRITTAGVDDADRVLGWDRSGRLLFTRHGEGDLPAARLARLDPVSGRVDALGPRSGYTYDPQLRGDQLSYISSPRPLITLPAPEQPLELILADLEGRPLTTVPLRGALPTRPTLRQGRLVFQLDGRAQLLAVDPKDGDLELMSLRLPQGVTTPPVGAMLTGLSMPYVHQVYDTPNSFNGNWACGPTSTLMAVQHFGRLKTWPITVSIPSSHTSNYGAYVALKYTFSGTTFNRTQNDASGKPAQGAYGWCTDNGAGWAWRMQDYAKKHNLKSDFTGTATFSAVKSALSAGKVVVLSTQLTSAGHLITLKGVTSAGKLVVNDPYGDRNLPSYPNYKGKDAVYSWTQVKAKWMITVHGTPTAPATATRPSAPPHSFPKTMVSGSTATATVTYQNKGTKAWSTDKTRLGTTKPQDRKSPFYSSGSWLGQNRPASADKAAKTDESASFSFTLTAPAVCKATSYKEAFNLLQEGVAWFSDSGQGGPADDDLTVEIQVTPADADGDGSALGCGDCDDTDAAIHPGATEVCNGKDDNCDGTIDEGCDDAGGAAGDAGVVPGSDAGGGDDALPPLGHDAGHGADDEVLQGGCAGWAARGPRRASGWPLLLLLLALVARRRSTARPGSA